MTTYHGIVTIACPCGYSTTDDYTMEIINDATGECPRCHGQELIFFTVDPDRVFTVLPNFDTIEHPESEMCLSRGPRIGDDGCPYCKRTKGHAGTHQPAPADGWPRGMAWSDPW